MKLSKNIGYMIAVTTALTLPVLAANTVPQNPAPYVYTSGTAAFPIEQQYALTALQPNFSKSITGYFANHFANGTASVEMVKNLHMANNVLVYDYYSQQALDKNLITQAQMTTILKNSAQTLGNVILNYNINEAMLKSYPLQNSDIGSAYLEPLSDYSNSYVAAYYISLLDSAISQIASINANTSSVNTTIAQIISIEKQAEGVLGVNQQGIPVNNVGSFSNYSPANFNENWLMKSTQYKSEKLQFSIATYPYYASKYTYGFSQPQNYTALKNKFLSVKLDNTPSSYADYFRELNNILVYAYYLDIDYDKNLVNQKSYTKMLNSARGLYTLVAAPLNTTLNGMQNSSNNAMEYTLNGTLYTIPNNEYEVLQQVVNSSNMIDSDPNDVLQNILLLNQCIKALESSKGINQLNLSNSNQPTDINKVNPKLYFPQSELDSMMSGI